MLKRGKIRLGRIGNIDLLISPFFILWLIPTVLLGQGELVLALFTMLTLHELSHVAVALAFHCRVAEIELMPMGGVARLEANLPVRPQAEATIALAGPVCSLALAFTCVALFYGLGRYGPQLQFLANVNLSIAFINLIPAMPLDGGRAMRALLSRALGLKKATHLVVSLGKVLSLGLGAMGIVLLQGGQAAGLSYLLAAPYIFLCALAEGKATPYLWMRDMNYKELALQQQGFLPVQTIAVRGDTPLQDVLNRMAPSRYYQILILDRQNAARGVLGEREIGLALSEGMGHIAVARIYQMYAKN